MLWPPAASAQPSAASAGTGGGLLPDPLSCPSLFSRSPVMLLACQSDAAAGGAACYDKFTVPSKLGGKVLRRAA